MKRQPEDWRDEGDDSVWITSTKLTDADIDRLQSVRYLTLLDTRVPDGFLDQLPQLELLDLRGAQSAGAVRRVAALPKLRALAISHARNLIELPNLESLTSLEFLDLYGLAQLVALPPMRELVRLRRVNLGQLGRLSDWASLTSLTALEELELNNRLTPDLDVLAQLAVRPSFTGFMWSAPDEPQRKVAAAEQAANRPKPQHVRIRDLWNSRT
ncbi:leucine-rich repeat domain-containing protein [Kribbella qitaiheensis]|uniref:Leucine-rich repeat domain-containing protein n=1 Tax=Kribbella qitaiheensis TaxID=1544730 RepID=A0A7G6WZJ9_9ACTN|nr:hypothetical protein [Kribbella qitaiheensis]QNE19414.1 leucine-rich repeat domain-containing protein [Kribbella qitaiheensis]